MIYVNVCSHREYKCQSSVCGLITENVYIYRGNSFASLRGEGMKMCNSSEGMERGWRTGFWAG